MKASSSRAASNNALRGRPANSDQVEVIVGPSGKEGRARSRPPLVSIGSCFVSRDRLFEILAFVAARRAELRQHGKLFLRFVHVSCLDEELAKIFARGFVVRLQVERLRVVGKRRRVVARLAEGEAQEIVNVGVLVVLGEVT